jgi:ribosomal protein S18 acetylase RimI-like enzyme
MDLYLKQAKTQEDAASLARLASAIWTEYYAAIITTEQIDYMLGKFQSEAAILDQIRNQALDYFLMQANGGDVGYLAVKEEAGQLFLSKFYVLKEQRGQGYASQAMAFLEKLCRSRGLRSIWLTVNRYNASSIAIYEKKGFVKVRTQVADIGNGYVMDDYIMEKNLPDA